MTKEKKASLTKYVQELTNKLETAVPSKHKGHPESYKQFLQREITIVKAQLEAAKLEGVK